MHAVTYYEVRVNLHMIEDKDIYFDTTIADTIRYELEIQQYNSNRDKVEIAPTTKPQKIMHSPSLNNTTEIHSQVLHPEPSDKKTITIVASVDMSTPQDSGEHMIRPV